MPSLRTLPEALRDAAAGGHGCLFIGGGSPGHHDDIYRSYADLHAAALGVSRSLRDLGLQRGDVVALGIDDAESFLVTLFGASMAGLLPASLLPPGATRDLESYYELTARVLRSSGARALVTSVQLVEGFENIRASCPTLTAVVSCGELMDRSGDPPGPSDEPGVDDLAFVQFTSGATSEPKGVALTHRNVCENVNAINGPSGLATTEADSAVTWLPLHHDMGLVGMALGPLYASRPAVFLPTHAFVRRPAEWLRAISRHRATVSFAPNFAYDLCVRRVKMSDLEGVDLSCWRVAGCGAEPIHAPTLAAFAERFRSAGFRETSFLPGYGLAEHVVAATFAPRDRPIRTDGALVSCGVPLPGHRLRIVNENGADLSEREVGEILLSGPSVMQGYFENGRVTRDQVHEGWLRTGDLGYLAAGELYVCGRLKDLIIANGRKIHPQDLEESTNCRASVVAHRPRWRS
jgi:fatty-acyl-CoA synthase